jgi:hypothetical protein
MQITLPYANSADIHNFLSNQAAAKGEANPQLLGPMIPRYVAAWGQFVVRASIRSLK